jgi:hypothetical protein
MYSSTILYLGTKWALRPCFFNPRGRNSSAHWIGVWVGPEPILTLCSREKCPGCEGKDAIYFVSRNGSVTNPDITALGDDIADNG